MKFRDYVSLTEAKLSAEMDELQLYIDNDYQMYKSQFIPILKNYTKKMRKGIYDRKMAAKGFMHLLDRGARQYVKEFGSPGDKVQTMFPKKDREKLAMQYAMQFEIDYKNQEYDFMKENVDEASLYADPVHSEKNRYGKWEVKKYKDKWFAVIRNGIDIGHEKTRKQAIDVIKNWKSLKEAFMIKEVGGSYVGGFRGHNTASMVALRKEAKKYSTEKEAMSDLTRHMNKKFHKDYKVISEAQLSEATRPLYEIARDIKKDWKKVNYAAKPYLDAMSQLDKITDMYMYDSAVSVVLYFLSNASTWRGPMAKQIKTELKAMAKGRGI